jgi:hypothetical protein
MKGSMPVHNSGKTRYTRNKTRGESWLKRKDAAERKTPAPSDRAPAPGGPASSGTVGGGG